MCTSGNRSLPVRSRECASFDGFGSTCCGSDPVVSAVVDSGHGPLDHCGGPSTLGHPTLSCDCMVLMLDVTWRTWQMPSKDVNRPQLLWPSVQSSWVCFSASGLRSPEVLVLRSWNYPHLRSPTVPNRTHHADHPPTTCGPPADHLTPAVGVPSVNASTTKKHPAHRMDPLEDRTSRTPRHCIFQQCTDFNGQEARRMLGPWDAPRHEGQTASRSNQRRREGSSRGRKRRRSKLHCHVKGTKGTKRVAMMPISYIHHTYRDK